MMLLNASEYRLDTLYKTTMIIKKNTFEIWLALDPVQKKKGLSSIRKIEKNQGMLFAYPFVEKLSFWMKDTHMALDIIYFQKDGKIVDVFTMPKETLTHYVSSSKVTFALELLAGSAKKMDLKVGEQIEVPQDILELLQF